MTAAYIAAGIAAALIGYAGSYIAVHRSRSRRIRERMKE
jgi:hypothetical protein